MKAVNPDPANRYANPNELAAALGRRPRVTRQWTRDTPCTGPTTCFTGTKAGAVTVKVCAVPTGPKGRHTIESRRMPAGNRTGLPWPEATPATLMRKLRSRFRDLP
jgi:serine/threonine-protein kinase